MTDYKSKISSAMLSDILDEMGHQNQMLPKELQPNFLEARIFGRARTIQLKRLEAGENYAEVYKGLHFLEQMERGDVLVVANGFPDMAFFGELMSTLAKYKGVDGVVVDGCTRDFIETIKMQYPVFARGHYGRDIKKRGIVGDLDCQVTVGTVEIKKEDLIFGDCEGIVIIPKEIEDKVLSKCIEVADLEAKIKEDILKGLPINKILDKRGEF